MTNDAYPIALVKAADDRGADGHAANLFDLAAGNGLAIGDQGQRLQRGSRILLRALLPEPANPRTQGLAHLKTKTAGDFDQFVSAIRAALAHFGQGLAQVFFGRSFVLFEQRPQLRYG